MAEVQDSGPLAGYNFTDDMFRALYGDEPGVLGDYDGTAFKLTLPGSGDVLQCGSTTQDSVLQVGGKGLRIPAGTTQSLTIPASTNAAVGRTDIICGRLDPTVYNTPPGPVRLYRIPGVEGSATMPAWDQAPPGVEEEPLYAFTRKQGQALSAATVVDLRRRVGRSFLVNPGVALPTSVPLGSRAHRDGVEYLRRMGPSAPEWYDLTKAALDAAKAAAQVGSVRPLYTRGRDADVQVSAVTDWCLTGADVSGGAGDWSTHIGITPAPLANPAVGDVFTLKTAGVYSIEVMAQCILAGVASGPEGGYDIRFDVLAGGPGSGVAGRLPRGQGTANPYSSAGVPLTSTRYWAAGSQFRLIFHPNAGGTLMMWNVLIMKVSD